MSRGMKRRGNKFTGNLPSSDLVWPAEEAPRHVTKHRITIIKGLKGPNIIIKSYCVKGGFGYKGELKTYCCSPPNSLRIELQVDPSINGRLVENFLKGYYGNVKQQLGNEKL